MSINIRSSQPTEQTACIGEYLDNSFSHGEHCLVESIGYIVTRQDDNSYCAIAMQDAITFTIYATGQELLNDFGLDGDEEIIILDRIDITYHKEME